MVLLFVILHCLFLSVDATQPHTSEGLVDEACVFIAPKIFGGEGKYSPVSGTGVDVPADAHMFGLDEVRRFDEDVMLRYKKV